MDTVMMDTYSGLSSQEILSLEVMVATLVSSKVVVMDILEETVVNLETEVVMEAEVVHHPGGLPPTGSWQDLKDHMREAGDICYADVYKDGTGVCEFLHKEDMNYACRKLDDLKFRSHEGETSYVRMKEETGSHYSSGGGGHRSRSHSRSMSLPHPSRGSPRYSQMRSCSRSPN